MSIRLYNALAREVRDFEPIDPMRVTLYVCGPTVYDTPHLGNARPAIVFDTLFRLLRHTYGADAVFYARNFTDIDDKIMARAAENGERIEDLTNRTIHEYHEVTEQLSVLLPTFEPRATHTIPEIIAMIKTLIAKGVAYEIAGHVYFNIDAWPQHGALSGHKQEDLNVSTTTKGLANKRSDGDFVLWKPSSNDQPGWVSQWGFGRPGWHIECSAMIAKHLGETIDIHGGGADLRFPHHECEISQSHAAHGHAPARFWVHNGMVTIDGRKMAKSDGNFITARQAIEEHGGDVVRLALLSTHYRQNMNWTQQVLRDSLGTLRGWHKVLDGVEGEPRNNDVAAAILHPLHNDLNTVGAIAALNSYLPEVESPAVSSGIRYAAGVMGFDLVRNDEWLRGGPDREEIEAAIEQRAVARLARDWAESDRLRDLLNAKGVVVEDRGTSYVWSRR